jgi:hypothetical protein
MIDLHIVYAVTSSDRTKVRVSEPLPWTEAVDEFTRLDDLRRAGKLPQTAFFAVRSADDPEWPALSGLQTTIYTRPAKEHTSSVSVHGYSEAARYAAVRAYRERGGDPGSGGWFYEIGSTWQPDRRNLGLRRRTLAQGYRHLIQIALGRGWIVQTANGYARILVSV